MSESVSWNGLTAVYTQDELAVMADLKAGVGAGEVDRRELEVFHELKSLLGAELRTLESDPQERGVYAVEPENEKRAPQRRRHEALDGQVSFFNS